MLQVSRVLQTLIIVSLIGLPLEGGGGKGKGALSIMSLGSGMEISEPWMCAVCVPGMALQAHMSGANHPSLPPILWVFLSPPIFSIRPIQAHEMKMGGENGG